MRITLRSKLPEVLINERLNMPVTSLDHKLDAGLIMFNAMEVNREASLEYYKNFHNNFEQNVNAEVEALQQLKPDLLLANVPYVSLCAAAKLNIPSIAMCSLNWADIFKQYSTEYPEAAPIIEQIKHAYALAETFLTVTPAMTMPSLSNTQAIPPILQRGTAYTDKLRKLVNNDQAKFVLVGLGGIPIELSAIEWPTLPNVYWVINDTLDTSREDVIGQNTTELSYIDLMKSCQAVLTKTGYGMLVESTTNQTPVICIDRGIWPEQPALFEWVEQNGYLRTITLDDLYAGDFAAEVVELLNIDWQKPALTDNGAEVAAKIISPYLQ
jgi:UDP-N-acetylglucosamine:LPS N-acetylglucosamine transferase